MRASEHTGEGGQEGSRAARTASLGAAPASDTVTLRAARERRAARAKRAAVVIALVIVLAGLAAGGGGVLYLYALLPTPQYAVEARAVNPAAIPNPHTTWTHFAGDAAATQYSSLAQITPDNVERLSVAWVHRTGEAERRGAELARSAFSNTPILAGGSLIVCTPWARVIALDPATGAERWSFDPEMHLRQPADHRFVCRGVAAWVDPLAEPAAACRERLIYGTNDLRVFALDAVTGKPCSDFGGGGQVEVPVEGGEKFAGEVQFNGPPAVIDDVVVLGSTVTDHVRVGAPSGVVRAFDARTGAPRWEFDPIPRDPADPAYATWEDGSALRHGGANVWADMSVDEDRGIVYIATSTPSLDFDGRTRPGDNRYANSVVALDGATGQRLWDFQVVRHDIWDYDLPTAPLLTTLEVEGAPRDVAIQLTKQGLVFVLDRVTGKPVFPVEDRPVPVSDVPGERTALTQPFPVTMPWLMGLGLTGDDFSADDAWGFTFWDRAHCRRHIERSRILGLYAPASREGTITYPWPTGGSNHGMRAYDPGRRLLVANLIRTVGVRVWPVYGDDASEEGGTLLNGNSGLLVSPLGAPCLAPPWGELLALDVEHQEVVWRVPLGTIEKRLPLPLPLRLPFGTPNRGGPLLTGSGLVFIAATMDDAFRAFSTDTGHELWRTELPAGGQATPMTYMAEGRQYVVIAAGGHSWMGTTPGDYVIAYALPEGSRASDQ